MMSKVKAIIVDDELNSRIVLQELLLRYCPDVEVCGLAEGAAEAFVLVETMQPSLVFLDVQMPGESGFDFLRRYDTPPFSVIFVTSHHQYAINAIRINAIDYLLKPVDVNDLKIAVSSAIARQREKDHETGLQNVVELFDDRITEKKIMVHHLQQVLLIPISKIVYASGEDNYSKIVTNDNKEYVLGKTLKDVEMYFSVVGKFLRVRRELLLNIGYISSYSKTEPCIITLENGLEIEVSRRKRQEVLEFLRKEQK